MKTTPRILLVLLLAFAAGARAHGDDAAGLEAVAAVALINGQALACKDMSIAQRAKALLLAHAPKTPRYAAAYDEGTQQAFLALTRTGAACADTAQLAARLDAAGQRLQAAFAGAGHAPAIAAGEPAARTAPRYLLQGPGGRAVTSEDFRGRFQLVTFGFTSCPDVCPTTLQEMQQALVALGERAARLQPIFITIDPERDVAVVLEAYTAAFDARIVALGGNEALVRRAADAFNVRANRIQEPGARPGAYTMEHTAGFFLLGPDGELLERIGYGTPVGEIVARIERWMGVVAQ